MLSCLFCAGARRRAVPGLLHISRHGVFGGASPPLHQTTQSKIYRMLIAALLASIHRALRQKDSDWDALHKTLRFQV